VLGGVSIDDCGLAGAEYYYDSALRGREGQQLIMKDARRKEYLIETIKETEPGRDIYLTIDSNLQYLAEKELKQAIEEFKANWGTVIIMSPASGEILAMASYPDYDPNNFPPSEEAMLNRAIQYTYEPGSTAKIVTAAAARELAGISYATYYDCRAGLINFGGTTVRDHVRLGILSFPDVLFILPMSARLRWLRLSARKIFTGCLKLSSWEKKPALIFQVKKPALSTR